MEKSPGHKQWPEHSIREESLRQQRVQVIVGSEVIADSADVLKVVEDKHTPRYYFPRDDVKMDRLEPSDTTTECPFKGKARYFNLKAGGRNQEDAVWSYEEPYEEHARLKDRLAFYEEKSPDIVITPKI